MSSSEEYNMVIEVMDFTDRDLHILTAVNEQWHVDYQWIGKEGDTPILVIIGDYYLGSMETEADAVRRIATAIREAADGCRITIRAICLDKAPHAQHTYGEAEFATWKEGKA
jgi:hypothetical protein